MDYSEKAEEMKQLGRTPCPAYDKLALIYDRVMSHVEYDRWAKYVVRIIRKYSDLPVTLLDVGCGTGNLLKKLQKLGGDVAGCEPSESMLKVAGEKLPGSALIQDALPSLSTIPEGRFSVITCLYDTINYVGTAEEVRQSLRRFSELLPVGGLLIFDAVSEALCQVYFNHSSEHEVLDEHYAFARYAYYLPEKKQEITELTIYTPDGIFEERHVQQIYPYSNLKSWIEEIPGFKLVGMFDGFTFNRAEHDSNRVHFVVKKERIDD
ncbi:MAG: class I SAM-dependent methyltransferase [Calditrichia bacterium]